LKPSCSWCKNYDNYVENVQLRILLQCYKKLCAYITSTDIYRKLASAVNPNGGSLIDLINEGAGFKVRKIIKPENNNLKNKLFSG